MKTRRLRPPALAHEVVQVKVAFQALRKGVDVAVRHGPVVNDNRSRERLFLIALQDDVRLREVFVARFVVDVVGGDGDCLLLELLALYCGRTEIEY